MKRIFLWIILFLSSVVTLFAASMLPWGINEALDTGFIAPLSGSKDVATPEGCRKISGVWVSQSYFAPTKTTTEWNAFKAHLPAGISIGTCIVPWVCSSTPGNCTKGSVLADSGPVSGTNNKRTWKCSSIGTADTSCQSCYPDKTSTYEGCYTSGIHDMYTKRSYGSTVETNSGWWMFGAGSPRCYEPAFSCQYGVPSIPPPPVNGSCNNSIPLGCGSGSIAYSDNGQTACSTTRTWICKSTTGGSDSPTCSKANSTCSYTYGVWVKTSWFWLGGPSYVKLSCDAAIWCWAHSYGAWYEGQTCANLGSTLSYIDHVLSLTTSYTCKTPSYTYSWSSSSWGACSLPCGGWIQTRSVVCQRNDGVTVADGNCSGGKPTEIQSCNTNACAPTYTCSEGPIFDYFCDFTWDYLPNGLLNDHIWTFGTMYHYYDCTPSWWVNDGSC